jgi:hypothetical protein
MIELAEWLCHRDPRWVMNLNGELAQMGHRGNHAAGAAIARRARQSRGGGGNHGAAGAIAAQPRQSPHSRGNQAAAAAIAAQPR